MKELESARKKFEEVRLKYFSDVKASIQSSESNKIDEFSGVTGKWYLDELSVSRVAQLDALLINSQLNAFFKASVQSLLKFISNNLKSTTSGTISGTFLDRRPLENLVEIYSAEFDLICEMFVWLFCMRVNSSTPGDVIQNLRYRNERAFPHFARISNTDYKKFKPNLFTKIHADEPTRTQRLLSLVLNTYFPYIFFRYKSNLEILASETDATTNSNSVSSNNFNQIQALISQMTQLERIYRFFSLVNFLLFLRFGKYRSLVDRFLALRLAPKDFQGTRPVAFEVINQLILYDRFSSMLLSVIQLMNTVSSGSTVAGVLGVQFWSNLWGLWGGMYPLWGRLKRLVNGLMSEVRMKVRLKQSGVTRGMNRIIESIRSTVPKMVAETFDSGSETSGKSLKSITNGTSETVNENCLFCGTKEICNRYILSCGHFSCYYCFVEHAGSVCSYCRKYIDVNACHPA